MLPAEKGRGDRWRNNRKLTLMKLNQGYKYLITNKTRKGRGKLETEQKTNHTHTNTGVKGNWERGKKQLFSCVLPDSSTMKRDRTAEFQWSKPSTGFDLLCSSAEIHKQTELTALSSPWMGISDTGSKIKVELLNLCILLPDLQSW